MKLSVIIPVFNEAATIREVLRRVAVVPIPKEIIVVDDGSTDGTADVLRRLRGIADLCPEDPSTVLCELQTLFHERNQGKGASVRTALEAASGDVVVIQDADLEYNPAEYHKLLQPILDGEADVVYGSRFTGSPRRVLFFWHSLGNGFLTLVSNMFTDLNLTDMETCYKMFRTEALRRIRLRTNRFGFDPEITVKVARQGLRIFEVPISYAGRTYAEGKKVNWKDGLVVLWTILRFSLFDDTPDSEEKTLRRVSRLSRYNAWLWDDVKPYVGQRVLEVGSGIGTMTQFALDRELVVATDIDPLYLSRLESKWNGRTNIVVRHLDLNQIESNRWRPYRLDTILCMNVLEHIEDDERTLQQLFEMLPAGGRVVLIIPALQKLYGEIDRAIGHFRRYERQEIHAKLLRAGFEVEQVKFFNVLGIPGWFLNARVLRRSAVPGFQSRLNDLLVPLLRLERYVRLPFGMSLLAVGRKPLVDSNAEASVAVFAGSDIG